MSRIILLMFASLFTSVVIAQRGNVELGIKGGVNLADFNGNANSNSSRTGFHVGALVHIHTLNPKLAIQPEILFSTQGASFVDGTDKIDYINIPFLLQYLGRGGLRLETGPQVGALVSAKFEDNNGVEYDIKNQIKQSDLSWVFGMGFLSHTGLGVDARYNLGLSDITKGRGNVKNQVWQFGLFYQFR